MLKPRDDHIKIDPVLGYCKQASNKDNHLVSCEEMLLSVRPRPTFATLMWLLKGSLFPEQELIRGFVCPLSGYKEPVSVSEAPIAREQ